MHIIYIKLVNHIPFKEDIELNINDSKFITIKGKTGSGKSYLMNCLHPFSNSSRHFRDYPIYPHKRGYKEIHYELDGDIIKIRHEYIANNKGSHSCKSYFMRNDKELNENGNNDTFKELVKKYLNYSQDVSHFSILSVKSSGFIDSTPTARSSTLFSLVESDTVKVMKENLLSNISDNNARIRLYKESRDEVLQGRNIDEDKETVKLYEKSIPEIESDIENLIREREELIVQLTKFKESTSKIDKNNLRIISNFLKRDDIKEFLSLINLDTIGSLQKYMSNIDIEINKLTSEFNLLDSERKTLFNKINSIKNREIIKTKLVELNRDLINIENIIKEVIKMDKISNFSTLEYVIKDLGDNINVLKSLEIYNVKDSSTLVQYISNLDEQIKDLEELYSSLQHVEKIGSIIDSEDSLKCPSCGDIHPILLSIYNGMKEKRSSSEIKNKILSIRSKRDRINQTFSNIKSNINRVITSDILSDKLIYDSNLKDIDKFLYETLSSNNFILKTKYDHIKNYIINQYKTIVNDIKDYEMKISSYEVYYDNIDDLNKLNDELASKIESIKTKIEYNHNISNKFSFDGDFTEFTAYSISEVINLEEKYKDIFGTIEEYESDISSKELKIKEKKSMLESIKNRIINLKSIINRYEEIYNQLSIYSNKKKDLEIIKTILFQDIPKVILNGNIRYIEDSINTILTQNNIDMTITFNTDEKNGISIPVYINSKEVPDARALSSGETSLLSTLINTSLLSLLGYRVLLIDELDAHLDTIYRDIFGNIISSICQILNIDQIFFISHNLNIDNASMVITVGNVEGLDIDLTNKKHVKII